MRRKKLIDSFYQTGISKMKALKSSRENSSPWFCLKPEHILFSAKVCAV